MLGRGSRLSTRWRGASRAAIASIATLSGEYRSGTCTSGPPEPGQSRRRSVAAFSSTVRSRQTRRRSSTLVSASGAAYLRARWAGDRGDQVPDVDPAPGGVGNLLASERPDDSGKAFKIVEPEVVQL